MRDQRARNEPSDFRCHHQRDESMAYLSPPSATMREIELQARERVSRLEAHLIEESALRGQANEWAGKPAEERPTGATCGEALVARGRAEAQAASHPRKRD